MATIEVKWEVNVSSGLTTIELSHIGIKNKTEWDKLNRKKQEKLINDYLKESEEYIHPIVTDW